MKRSFVMFSAMAFFMMACKSRSERVRMEAIREGMERYGKQLEVANQHAVYEMERKRRDLTLQYKAARWQPKMDSVQKVTDEMLGYINDLRNAIKKDSTVAIDQLFRKQPGAEMLHKRLS
ncbi:MAG: hypothetical protein JST39_24775, partial [Bacteroidetes bacterium]|nr:hypothetical protein [Bacteroidota bacterium]